MERRLWRRVPFQIFIGVKPSATALEKVDPNLCSLRLRPFSKDEISLALSSAEPFPKVD